MNLFLRGTFVFNSGVEGDWKIECDALTEEDWQTLAMLISRRVGSFSDVEGVPRGGLKLARYLTAYMTPHVGPLLIVDDVCTTGGSLERQRAGRLHGENGILGFVVFNRGTLPIWCSALFTLGN